MARDDPRRYTRYPDLSGAGDGCDGGLARRATAGSGAMRRLGASRHERTSDPGLFSHQRGNGAARWSGPLHRGADPAAQSVDLLRAARPGTPADQALRTRLSIELRRVLVRAVPLQILAAI